MNRLIGVVLVIVLVATTGCSSLNSNTSIHSWKTKYSYDPEKLTYDTKRRAWFYDKMALVFLGKKVREKDQALALINAAKDSPASFSAVHETSGVAQIIFVSPGFVLMSAGVVIASPFIAMDESATSKDAFERMTSGEKLLAEGQFAAARQKFYEANFFHPTLAANSDILFKLAESYDSDGKTDLAKIYYNAFLETSFDLYPRIFEEYNAKYANNIDILDSELSKATEKTGSAQLKPQP